METTSVSEDITKIDQNCPTDVDSGDDFDEFVILDNADVSPFTQDTVNDQTAKSAINDIDVITIDSTGEESDANNDALDDGKSGDTVGADDANADANSRPTSEVTGSQSSECLDISLTLSDSAVADENCSEERQDEVVQSDGPVPSSLAEDDAEVNLKNSADINAAKSVELVVKNPAEKPDVGKLKWAARKQTVTTEMQPKSVPPKTDCSSTKTVGELPKNCDLIIKPCAVKLVKCDIVVGRIACNGTDSLPVIKDLTKVEANTVVNNNVADGACKEEASSSAEVLPVCEKRQGHDGADVEVPSKKQRLDDSAEPIKSLTSLPMEQCVDLPEVTLTDDGSSVGIVALCEEMLDLESAVNERSNDEPASMRTMTYTSSATNDSISVAVMPEIDVKSSDCKMSPLGEESVQPKDGSAEAISKTQCVTDKDDDLADVTCHPNEQIVDLPERHPAVLKLTPSKDDSNAGDVAPCKEELDLESAVMETGNDEPSSINATSSESDASDEPSSGTVTSAANENSPNPIMSVTETDIKSPKREISPPCDANTQLKYASMIEPDQNQGFGDKDESVNVTSPQSVQNADLPESQSPVARLSDDVSNVDVAAHDHEKHNTESTVIEISKDQTASVTSASSSTSDNLKSFPAMCETDTKSSESKMAPPCEDNSTRLSDHERNKKSEKDENTAALEMALTEALTSTVSDSKRASKSSNQTVRTVQTKIAADVHATIPPPPPPTNQTKAGSLMRMRMEALTAPSAPLPGDTMAKKLQSLTSIKSSSEQTQKLKRKRESYWDVSLDSSPESADDTALKGSVRKTASEGDVHSPSQSPNSTEDLCIVNKDTATGEHPNVSDKKILGPRPLMEIHVKQPSILGKFPPHSCDDDHRQGLPHEPFSSAACHAHTTECTNQTRTSFDQSAVGVCDQANKQAGLPTANATILQDVGCSLQQLVKMVPPPTMLQGQGSGFGPTMVSQQPNLVVQQPNTVVCATLSVPQPLSAANQLYTGTPTVSPTPMVSHPSNLQNLPRPSPNYSLPSSSLHIPVVGESSPVQRLPSQPNSATVSPSPSSTVLFSAPPVNQGLPPIVHSPVPLMANLPPNVCTPDHSPLKYQQPAPVPPPDRTPPPPGVGGPLHPEPFQIQNQSGFRVNAWENRPPGPQGPNWRSPTDDYHNPAMWNQEPNWRPSGFHDPHPYAPQHGWGDVRPVQQQTQVWNGPPHDGYGPSYGGVPPPRPQANMAPSFQPPPHCAPPPHGVPPPHGAPPPHGVPPPHGAPPPHGVPPPHGAPLPQGVPPPPGAQPPHGGPPPPGVPPQTHAGPPLYHSGPPQPYVGQPPPHGPPPQGGPLPPLPGGLPQPHGAQPPYHGGAPQPHGSMPPPFQPHYGAPPQPQGNIPPPYQPPYGGPPQPQGNLPSQFQPPYGSPVPEWRPPPPQWAPPPPWGGSDGMPPNQQGGYQQPQCQEWGWSAPHPCGVPTQVFQNPVASGWNQQPPYGVAVAGDENLAQAAREWAEYSQKYGEWYYQCYGVLPPDTSTYQLPAGVTGPAAVARAAASGSQKNPNSDLNVQTKLNTGSSETKASAVPPVPKEKKKSSKDAAAKASAVASSKSKTVSETAFITARPVLFRPGTGDSATRIPSSSADVGKHDTAQVASATPNTAKSEAAASKPAEGVSLLINNLAVGTKAVDVRSLMSTYGKVVNCKVGVMKSQKEAGGLFALVVMEQPYEATLCVNRLHMSTFGGRTISVMLMKPSS